MNRMVCSVGLLMGLGAVGCQSRPQSPPPVAADFDTVDRPVLASVAPAPVTTQDLANAQKLEVAPVTVRAAFLRDFPDAGITNINAMISATGVLLYEINFLSNGQTGRAVYTVDGIRVAPEPIPLPRRIVP